MPDSQLSMIKRNLEELPEIDIPEEYGLRTYRPGDEEAWAEIMSSGIGEWTPDKCREELISQPQFLPDGLFFMTCHGHPIGSACAYRNSPEQWEEGYLHMVCVLPEHRGKQLGYLLTLAVLRYFHDHGFKQVVLQTDDFRVPAIKAYLRLGFEPLFTDDTHPDRWKKLLDQ